jgi:hypothetical protein
VSRYQTSTGTLTVNLPQYGLVHTFQVDMNRCDNSFTGSGVSYQHPEFGGTTETIKGSLNKGPLSFKATSNPWRFAITAGVSPRRRPRGQGGCGRDPAE